MHGGSMVTKAVPQAKDVVKDVSVAVRVVLNEVRVNDVVVTSVAVLVVNGTVILEVVT